MIIYANSKSKTVAKQETVEQRKKCIDVKGLAEAITIYFYEIDDPLDYSCGAINPTKLEKILFEFFILIGIDMCPIKTTEDKLAKNPRGNSIYRMIV